MIDVLHWSAYKINVILIIMLKSKVLCDVVGEFPVEMPSVHDFTEYFIEHNVTQKDAITAFRLQADDLLKSYSKLISLLNIDVINIFFISLYRKNTSLVCAHPMQ